MKKANSGITLVALVVTIIVLIILAGVSISLVLGSDGILGRARSGRNNYAVAANQEHDALDKIDKVAANEIAKK